MQLGHSGRKGSTQLSWERMDHPLERGNWPVVSASPIPYYEGISQVPKEISPEEMRKVVADFERSARYADEAGFDMLEIHMAHGYLLASFISPLTNRRDDEYGGALPNRMRFPLEVFDRVRRVWPEEKPMSVRISAVDWHPKGHGPEDAVDVARLLKEHGCDIVDVSAGQTVADQKPVYGRLFQTPFADRIRHEVGIATMAVGNISSYMDVNTIIAQAAQQANITRAAIRQPLGSNARVSIAVVDTNGVVLGLFRLTDAPVFGFDVSVQKARTAAFYSGANAGALLRAAGFGLYVDRAAADGLKLDGSVAFTDRAGGFLHRPFFPDGINNSAAGPFSRELNEWSVFNVGLQLDLIKTGLQTVLGGGAAPCTSIPGLFNGIQIFPGSMPLYKNGVLVGAIGISGDGVDQDDLIAAAGGAGFAPPAAIRSDQIFVRGVRLPFLKFPRSPNL
jgi:uncharacterized protein GlcG (DUF336 family)